MVLWGRPMVGMEFTTARGLVHRSNRFFLMCAVGMAATALLVCFGVGADAETETLNPVGVVSALLAGGLFVLGLVLLRRGRERELRGAFSGYSAAVHAPWGAAVHTVVEEGAVRQETVYGQVRVPLADAVLHETRGLAMLQNGEAAAVWRSADLCAADWWRLCEALRGAPGLTRRVETPFVPQAMAPLPPPQWFSTSAGVLPGLQPAPRAGGELAPFMAGLAVIAAGILWQLFG